MTVLRQSRRHVMRGTVNKAFWRPGFNTRDCWGARYTRYVTLVLERRLPKPVLRRLDEIPGGQPISIDVTCPHVGLQIDRPSGSSRMLESPPNRGIGPVFVGRHREMGELRTALDDAMSGRGRLIMLAGEPGIGKTRIAQELASTAEELGAPVLWGRRHDGPGRPP